jgi:fucose 4-O-acetylase-like acetyltransferase
MNQTPAYTQNQRVLFFDNIRYLMIIFVIVLHAAASYGINEWWYVYDPKEHKIIYSFVMSFIDTFAMPTLFFIAGYFALYKIEKTGMLDFIKSKIKRLAIPWFICIVFAAPVMDYINHHTHGYLYSSLNYRQFWLKWLQRAIDLQTGFYTSPAQFNQFAYWFISLLFFFFIIFSLIYAFKKWLFPSHSFLSEKTQSKSAIIVMMLSAGLLCTVAGALIAIIPFPYPDPWVILANVLQFQIWRLFVYMLFFALGVWAYGRGWFIKVNFPGHPVLWVFICAILCFVYVIVANHLLANITDKMFFLIFIFFRSFLRVIFLIVFISIAMRYWNRPHWINKTLASNSYNIYLIHQPIVIVFQLLLVSLVAVSSFIKFGIVLFFSFLFSYVIAEYAIKRHQLLSFMGLLVIFLLMVIFV